MLQRQDEDVLESMRACSPLSPPKSSQSSRVDAMRGGLRDGEVTTPFPFGLINEFRVHEIYALNLRVPRASNDLPPTYQHQVVVNHFTTPQRWTKQSTN